MSGIKLIDCPESQDHKAILYCAPRKDAGVWECIVEGISDVHEHDDYEIEETVIDYLGNEGHEQLVEKVFVCGGCGVIVEGDPNDR